MEIPNEQLILWIGYWYLAIGPYIILIAIGLALIIGSYLIWKIISDKLKDKEMKQ